VIVLTQAVSGDNGVRFIDGRLDPAGHQATNSALTSLAQRNTLNEEEAVINRALHL
jgi:hypothetical protein